MENTNEPLTPQPVPVTQAAKKWYRHKGIITIVILALMAGTAAWVYFILNQPQNYGPIVGFHKSKPEIKNQQPILILATQQEASSTQPVVENNLDSMQGNLYTYNNISLYLDSPDGVNEDLGVYEEKNNEKLRILDIGYDPIGGTFPQFATTSDPNIALVSLTTGDAGSSSSFYDYIDINTGKHVQVDTNSGSGFNITDSSGNKINVDYTYNDTCSHNSSDLGQKAYLTGLEINGTSIYKFTNPPSLICLPVDENDAFPQPYNNFPSFSLMNLNTNLSDIYFSSEIINGDGSGSVAWQSNFVYDLISGKLSPMASIQ